MYSGSLSGWSNSDSGIASMMMLPISSLEKSSYLIILSVSKLFSSVMLLGNAGVRLVGIFRRGLVGRLGPVSILKKSNVIKFLKICSSRQKKFFYLLVFVEHLNVLVENLEMDGLLAFL